MSVFRFFSSSNVKSISFLLISHPVFLWHLKMTLLLNDVRQMSQGYGFSPVWMRRWLFKLGLSLNVLVQKQQLIGFSLVWERKCCCRAAVVLNSLEHNSHFHGPSLVCFLCTCRVRILLRTVVKSQNWHMCFFSPPWVIKWELRLLFVMNALSYWEQLKGFSPVCVSEWTANSVE